jgi:hypothetical protein
MPPSPYIQPCPPPPFICCQCPRERPVPPTTRAGTALTRAHFTPLGRGPESASSPLHISSRLEGSSLHWQEARRDRKPRSQRHGRTWAASVGLPSLNQDVSSRAERDKRPQYCPRVPTALPHTDGRRVPHDSKDLSLIWQVPRPYTHTRDGV